VGYIAVEYVPGKRKKANMRVWDNDNRIDVEPREVILCDNCGRECNCYHNGVYLTCDEVDGKDYCSECLKILFIQNNL